MPVDKIKMYLYRANGEFEILPKDKWEPRHNYLNSKEPKAKYTHDKYEYMPSICVFRENEEITRICLQACPSKVLYGHNLQEITQQDFEPF